MCAGGEVAFGGGPRGGGEEGEEESSLVSPAIVVCSLLWTGWWREVYITIDRGVLKELVVE